MTSIKPKTLTTSPETLTHRPLTTQAEGTATTRANPFATDGLERAPRNRMFMDSLIAPEFGSRPGLGTFKVNDLINGAVPSFGKELYVPGNAIAPALETPNRIGEPSIGQMGFGVASMGHSVGAAASGQPGILDATAKWVTAGYVGVGAVALAIGATTTAAAAAAFGAGYSLGEAIDTQIQHSTGTSIGEAIYDAVHSDGGESSTGSSGSSDGGSAAAGTQEDQETQGAQSEEGDSGDAGVGETTGEGADNSESGDSGDSGDAGAGESAERASSSEQAESQRDPELPYRYRPSYAEIASGFGTTGASTVMHSNPNPHAEDREELHVSRSLGATADRRLVNEEGRTEAIGTQDQFGASVLSTLGTIRPAGESESEEIPSGGRFGGVDPAA